MRGMLPHINFAVESSPTLRTLWEGIGMFSSLSVFGEASMVMFQRSIMTLSDRASFSRSFGMLSPSYPPPHLKQRAKSLPRCFQRYSSSTTAVNDFSSQTCSEWNHPNCGLSFHFDWIFNWTIRLIMPWPISVRCFWAYPSPRGPIQRFRHHRSRWLWSSPRLWTSSGLGKFIELIINRVSHGCHAYLREGPSCSSRKLVVDLIDIGTSLKFFRLVVRRSLG